ncbi:MAG: resolvase, partial [Cytophagaceae bacterium]
AIATRLNGMGFRTRRGKEFLAMSVQRLDVNKLK